MSNPAAAFEGPAPARRSGAWVRAGLLAALAFTLLRGVLSLISLVILVGIGLLRQRFSCPKDDE
ncbi:MAG: hypothetical protein P1U69_11625 [Parvibaculaceae bacterium]|nr:hypothetical protein [Parvibaculaceae bacterium]